MSFDIFFIAPAEPLNATELQTVQSALMKGMPNGPDKNGCFVVDFADGGTAEFFGRDFAKGGMVATRGMTPELVQFLFDLLVCARWVMVPAMEDIVTITGSSETIHDVPSDFPRVVVCRSAKELNVILTDGVQAWEKYCAQVVGGSNPRAAE